MKDMSYTTPDGKLTKVAVDTVDEVLVAAVKRRGCPLMAYLTKSYPEGHPLRLGITVRLVFFYIWCARRAMMSYTHALEHHELLMCIFDERVSQALEQMHGGDSSQAEPAISELHDTFSTFDVALKHDDYPSVLPEAVMQYVARESIWSKGPMEALLVAKPTVAVLADIHEQTAHILTNRLHIDTPVTRNSAGQSADHQGKPGSSG